MKKWFKRLCFFIPFRFLFFNRRNQRIITFHRNTVNISVFPWIFTAFLCSTISHSFSLFFQILLYPILNSMMFISCHSIPYHHREQPLPIESLHSRRNSHFHTVSLSNPANLHSSSFPWIFLFSQKTVSINPIIRMVSHWSPQTIFISPRFSRLFSILTDFFSLFHSLLSIPNLCAPIFSSFFLFFLISKFIS